MPSHQAHKHKLFVEIVPDTRFVVFSGDEYSTESVKLRGVVRLHAPESMTIKGVKIRFEGKRRVGWYYSGGVSAGEVVDKKVFYQESKVLSAPGTHKIKAGVIEWPFEFTLAPDMPESVEGYPNTWLIYNLFADVERPMYQKDLHSASHIRLVRPLGADQMEMTRSRVNADIWANKISYSISIPTDAVVYGTSIVADVELAPLKKGITLGKVELKLVENFIRRIAPNDLSDYRNDRVKMDEFEVASLEMDFPEDSRVTFEDETADNPRLEDERYHFKARLPLPKSLKKCRQDVDTHAIHISHKFKLMVNIHNPEGHISQLVCRLPVKLFISPSLPIDDENQVLPGTTNMTEEELNNQESTINAPPVYGQHQLDEIFSDFTPSGYHTATHSNLASPSLSRRGSNEHLAAPHGTPPDAQGQVNSALLRSRLASLQEGVAARQYGPSNLSSSYNSSGHISPRPHMGQRMHSNRSTPNDTTPHSNSGQQSRRSSAEIHPESLPNPSFLSTSYDMADLSRIPSYGTALRTPSAATPFDEGPPSYFEATSRPPSPGHLSPTHASTASLSRLAVSNHSHSIDSALEDAHTHSPHHRSAPQTAPRTGFSSPDSAGSNNTAVAVPTGHGTRIDEGDTRLRLLRGRS